MYFFYFLEKRGRVRSAFLETSAIRQLPGPTLLEARNYELPTSTGAPARTRTEPAFNVGRNLDTSALRKFLCHALQCMTLTREFNVHRSYREDEKIFQMQVESFERTSYFLKLV